MCNIVKEWHVFEEVCLSDHRSCLILNLKVKYKGESKSKGKIHLTALTEVTVSNFTHHFST